MLNSARRAALLPLIILPVFLAACEPYEGIPVARSYQVDPDRISVSYFSLSDSHRATGEAMEARLPISLLQRGPRNANAVVASLEIVLTDLDAEESTYTDSSGITQISVDLSAEASVTMRAVASGDIVARFDAYAYESLDGDDIIGDFLLGSPLRDLGEELADDVAWEIYGSAHY